MRGEESVMLIQLVASFRSIFERQDEALRSIRAVIHREIEEEDSYERGLDMGSFAVSGISTLEEQLRSSLSILEEMLGELLPEKTLLLCAEPLMKIKSEEGLLQVIERDLILLARKSHSLANLEQNLLEKDPEELSKAIPKHVRENISEMIDRELDALGSP